MLKAQPYLWMLAVEFSHLFYFICQNKIIGELLGKDEDKTFAALFYIDLLRSMTPEERATGRCVRHINKEDADSDWFLEILDHLSWAMTYIDGDDSDNNTREFMFILPYESEEAKKFSKYD